MKVGELPRSMIRMIAPVLGQDWVFVRFTCRACDWTIGFNITKDAAVKITPEHYCPERERQVLQAEMGSGPGPEVM